MARKLSLTIATALALLLPLALTPPASAEMEVRHDATGETKWYNGDVRKVTVNHAWRKVVIRVVYVDRAKPDYLGVRIDIPRTPDRWDFQLYSDYWNPHWYEIWERGADHDEEPKCHLGRRWDNDDVLKIVVPRRCFDWAQRVRVRVSESDHDPQAWGKDRTGWTPYARRN